MTTMPPGLSPTPPTGPVAQPARPARTARTARTALAVGVIGAATLGAAVGLTLSSGGAPAGNSPSVAATAGPRGPSPAAPARQMARRRVTRPVAAQVARSTELATVDGAASRYASPGMIAAGTVPASWYGRPSVLPVIAVKPGWVEVRLAQRPDESTAWLPATDVTLGATPYQIVVDLATTKLSLFDDGRLVFSAPAGVGTTDDPTPTGQYFVAFDERPPQPNPGYGPFIMVTSAHSPTISDWEGSGDAVIGIHGPLGAGREIGTSGAKISHGCIRLQDRALEELTVVPPGTPITIVG
jgi:lipoprotein-anchoring transpeptidase ErfK/SrfK